MVAKNKDVDIGQMYHEELKSEFAEMCQNSITDPNVASFELVMGPKFAFLNIKLTETGLELFPIVERKV